MTVIPQGAAGVTLTSITLRWLVLAQVVTINLLGISQLETAATIAIQQEPVGIMPTSTTLRFLAAVRVVTPNRMDT